MKKSPLKWFLYFLIFREIKLKTFLIFSQKKALLTFQDTKTQKNLIFEANGTFLYFRKYKP